MDRIPTNRLIRDLQTRLADDASLVCSLEFFPNKKVWRLSCGSFFYDMALTQVKEERCQWVEFWIDRPLREKAIALLNARECLSILGYPKCTCPNDKLHIVMSVLHS